MRDFCSFALVSLCCRMLTDQGRYHGTGESHVHVSRYGFSILFCFASVSFRFVSFQSIKKAWNVLMNENMLCASPISIFHLWDLVWKLSNRLMSPPGCLARAPVSLYQGLEAPSGWMLPEDLVASTYDGSITPSRPTSTLPFLFLHVDCFFCCSTALEYPPTKFEDS
jgi:hypothetical protein